DRAVDAPVLADPGVFARSERPVGDRRIAGPDPVVAGPTRSVPTGSPADGHRHRRRAPRATATATAGAAASTLPRTEDRAGPLARPDLDGARPGHPADRLRRVARTDHA